MASVCGVKAIILDRSNRALGTSKEASSGKVCPKKLAHSLLRNHEIAADKSLKDIWRGIHKKTLSIGLV